MLLYLNALQIHPAIWDGHKLCAINSSTKLLDAQDGSGEHKKSGKDKMWGYANRHLLGDEEGCTKL